MRTLIAAFLLTGALLAQRQQPEIDLQAAICKEIVDGDLNGAIKQYSAIVTKYKSDRAVTAMALVHMAGCYQKMGDQESRKIYEQVVRDYGDQKQAVAMARARLGNNGTPAQPSGVTTRQLWTGPKANLFGSVSPDGRYISYPDWASGELGLYDVTTGATRVLTPTPPGAPPDGGAGSSAISRDGKTVAYAWSNRAKHRGEVRLANLTGDPNPRFLCDNPDFVGIFPHDWSPDGKWISVMLRKDENWATSVGVISASDGSLRILKSTEYPGPSKILFSRDGKFLAYDPAIWTPVGHHEIHVIEISSGREIPAVTDTNANTIMGWSPDGRSLLFASDRGGTMGLWAQRWIDGKPHGEAEPLKGALGINILWSMGVSPAGALFFGTRTFYANVEIASVDWETGRALSDPARVATKMVGRNYEPVWSPDGKQLAYHTARDPGGRFGVIAIESLETGLTTEVQPEMSVFNSMQWAPDGQSFLVRGNDRLGRSGIHRIDRRTGKVTLIAVREPGGSAGSPSWSPDGMRAYFSRTKSGVISFVELDLASGTERTIIRRSGGLGDIFVSPDGKSIVTSTAQTVLLIPLDGAEPKELIRVEKPQYFRIGGWLPNRSAVLVRKFSEAAPTASREVWLIPIGGGAPRKLTLDPKITFPIRFQPGGNQIAYTSVGGSESDEVWVMENFLPK